MWLGKLSMNDFLLPIRLNYWNSLKKKKVFPWSNQLAVVPSVIGSGCICVWWLSVFKVFSWSPAAVKSPCWNSINNLRALSLTPFLCKKVFHRCVRRTDWGKGERQMKVAVNSESRRKIYLEQIGIHFYLSTKSSLNCRWSPCSAVEYDRNWKKVKQVWLCSASL